MKVWVFDLDGTLVDSFELYFTILESLLGKPLDREERKTLIGIHPSDLFAQRLASPAQASAALQTLKEKSIDGSRSIPLFQGLSGVLQNLRRQGCRVAVWTSRGLESSQVLLEQTQINPYIEYLVSGDCVSSRKPHPQGLMQLREHFGCEYQEMVMVGDHDDDMHAARTAGALPIRATWHQHWDFGRCDLAAHQFYCPNEFSDWIQKMFEENLEKHQRKEGPFSSEGFERTIL